MAMTAIGSKPAILQIANSKKNVAHSGENWKQLDIFKRKLSAVIPLPSTK